MGAKEVHGGDGYGPSDKWPFEVTPEESAPRASDFPAIRPRTTTTFLMTLLWPGPDTPTQNYPHLTEEDMPGIQRCFFQTLDYLQQTQPHVLEQIWPPPG